MTHECCVDVVDFEAFADSAQHGDCERAAEMLAELFEACGECRVIGKERVTRRKTEPRDACVNARVQFVRQPTFEIGVTAIEEESERDRVAV